MKHFSILGTVFLNSFISSIACFFFHRDRENSPYIVKYSLRTERAEATITMSGYTASKNSYPWGSNTAGMDLAVDEQGLWVLWGSTGNGGKMYASKIDVYKNVITHTWTLNTGRHILELITTLNAERH